MQLMTCFVNLNPIVTFGVLVNDTFETSHDFSYHGNHFDGKLCVTILTKISMLLNWLVHAGRIEGVLYSVIHLWKVEVLNILLVFEKC